MVAAVHPQMVEKNPIASEITAVLLSSHGTAQKGNCRAPGGITSNMMTTYETINDF
jgi:hypothetical protein